MSLFSHGQYLKTCEAYRFIYFGGRLGSGKTAIAAYTGYELLRTGKAETLVSNIPHALQTFPPPEPLRKSVILMDEAGLFLDDWSRAKTFTAALRKQRNILLMPSMQPVHPRLRMVTVVRPWNWKKFGLPMWSYKWIVQAADGEQHIGWFHWWRPIADLTRHGNLYDTNYLPASDWNIKTAIAANLFKSKIGNSGSSSTRETVQQVEIAGIEQIGDAVERMIRASKESS